MNTGMPGGPRRRHEPSVVADLDGHHRHAARGDPEGGPVADRAQPDDDHVVVDVPRDGPATERLEEPRPDEGIRDERVDDGDDGRPDEAQEDRVDAQRGVAGGVLDVGRQRGSGQQRDGVRDRVERRQPGDEVEEDRRADGEDDEDRAEAEQSLLRGSKPAPDRLDGAPRGTDDRGGRSRRHDRPLGAALGELLADVDEDEVRVGARGVGQELDRPVGMQPGDRDRRRGAGRVRGFARLEDSPGQPEACAGLAVDRRGHEAGRRERRGRQGDGVGEELRDVRAELLVEHPDDDPQARVELHGRERRVEVGQVVVAGHDDRGGGLDVGLAQDPGEERIADDEPDPAVRQVIRGVVVGADPDDLLVAHPKLVDGAETEVVEPADDDVAGRQHRCSLRSGGAPGGVVCAPAARRQSARSPARIAAISRALVVP